jgi:hypothetical protein
MYYYRLQINSVFLKKIFQIEFIVCVSRIFLRKRHPIYSARLVRELPQTGSYLARHACAFHIHSFLKSCHLAFSPRLQVLLLLSGSTQLVTSEAATHSATQLPQMLRNREGILLCLQEPSTVPNLVPDQSTQEHPPPPSKIKFNIVSSLMSRLSCWCPYFWFSHGNCIYVFLFWLMLATKQTNSMVWVRERIIPTERPPLVGEVIANLCG